MKRSIIFIDEEKCNGCGNCVPGCPEGALQIIDGKARLVSDLFCDGLGACIGECPEGAIVIEEREAEPYNERLVMENIIRQGDNTVRAHLHHLKEHGETGYYNEAVQFLKENNYPEPSTPAAPKPVAVAAVHAHASHAGGGCPGSRTMDFRDAHAASPSPQAQVAMETELRQWPVQLHLLNPRAPFLKNADMVIAADCVPFTYPNFHQRFLKNRVLAIFCPKLDDGMDEYVEKLAEIFSTQDISSITLVHMEVPCCFGVERVVSAALAKAGKNIVIKDYTISIRGEIM
ncbi:MAG: 4Fe-4S dicluster domain-containing protein [Spirochaetes bacterium]|nr:MAG: 4Fe-4S dicluster domain-containing protein [Spirochaetota bacterium]